jgi:ribonucleoside-triphosphate reductase
MTSKYGLPYFQNYLGSGLDPKSIRAMCCRLNIDLRQLQHNDNALFGSGELTGSLGVVTINLNRLAYESHSKEEFFARIREHMELAKESLELKREMVDVNMKRGLIPYAKVYLGTLKNHFSTIGLIGMNEACINLLGESIASPAGKKLAIDTMNVMRDKILEFQRETGHLYNLEATPGEGTAYRLAKLDKAMYPKIITAGQQVPYLTNSTQLPVGYTDDVFEAVNHQQDIQPLYTGGTVFHTFLGESIDADGCKLLVKKLSKSKLPYYTLTPTFSICPNHGYMTGEVPKCPNCGQATEVFSRIVGYLRPISFWNDGKQEEYVERKVFAN